MGYRWRFPLREGRGRISPGTVLRPVSWAVRGSGLRRVLRRPAVPSFPGTGPAPVVFWDSRPRVWVSQLLYHAAVESFPVALTAVSQQLVPGGAGAYPPASSFEGLPSGPWDPGPSGGGALVGPGGVVRPRRGWQLSHPAAVRAFGLSVFLPAAAGLPLPRGRAPLPAGTVQGSAAVSRPGGRGLPGGSGGLFSLGRFDLRVKRCG